LRQLIKRSHLADADDDIRVIAEFPKLTVAPGASPDTGEHITHMQAALGQHGQDKTIHYQKHVKLQGASQARKLAFCK
jgi:hypothetical protein